MSTTAVLPDVSARWNSAGARLVLEALDASGLGVAEFARRNRIDPQRLRVWRNKLTPSRAPRLVELVARVQPSSGSVEIACPSGHVVRVRAADDLALAGAVLRMIEAIAC